MQRAPLFAIPLRTISAGEWSRSITVWNAKARDRKAEMRTAQAECRRDGHRLVVCPLGMPFCTRCCSYFPDEEND
jgi:hypothetical protein